MPIQEALDFLTGILEVPRGYLDGGIGERRLEFLTEIMKGVKVKVPYQTATGIIKHPKCR